MLVQLAVLLAVLLPLAASAGDPPAAPSLEVVASSTRLWTGVAVSREGRVFVNYPRWSDDVPLSVAELKDGEPVAFPSAEWNRWSPELPAGDHLVCVQSVYVDEQDFLWILDPASPKFAGVVDGGPKLLKVDLEKGEVVQTIRFAPDIAPARSYLNDVRVDTASGFAYVTDSGLGALVVVDVRTGEARRVLAEHPSTKAEAIDVTIGGKPWQRPDGTTPQVHSDGIALSPDRAFVYYQALTGRSLYRVPTEALRDASLSTADLGQRVERVAESGVADGIAFGRDGHLYLSALERDAINRLTPQGKVETAVTDPRIAWPDSFAVAADGALYFTTSQLHLGPQPPAPYRVWRLRVEGARVP